MAHVKTSGFYRKSPGFHPRLGNQDLLGPGKCKPKNKNEELRFEVLELPRARCLGKRAGLQPRR